MSPERISVAGIPVDIFTIPTLHEQIRDTIGRGQKKTILHSNAHLCQMANTTDKWLLDYFNNKVNYVHCDGAGIQLGAKLTRQPVPAKIPYNTWLWDFVSFLETNNYSVFLLGAENEVVNSTAQNFLKSNPNLKIAGLHHGFFNKEKNHPENKKVVELINSAKPNILLVAFGMPVQEKWIKENFDDLAVNVVLACGGAFDFISGKTKVAPRIFRVLYLEWFHRLLSNPGRLWKRYLIGNTRFLYYTLKRGKR